MGHDILEAYLKIAPTLKEVFQEDILVSVADDTRFLFCKPGDTIDLNIKSGNVVPEGDLLYRTIKTGKAYREIVSEEIFGIPFIGTTYPIKDATGKVVGAIGIARSLDKEFKVEKSAKTLFSSLEETNTSLEQIASTSEELLIMTKKMEAVTKLSESQIEESNKIINLIQNIAS